MTRGASCRVLVFARAPVPGRAKTRLIPALGAEGAAELAAHLTERALRAATAARIGPVELWCAPDPAHPFFADCARRYGVALRPQGAGDLGRRMHRALSVATPAILIGSDIPAMTSAYLRKAARALGRADVVLGPAEDGGYVLIGLKAPQPSLFRGVAWGRSSVLAQTRARIRRAGLAARELAPLFDVDRPADLKRLPRSAIDRRSPQGEEQPMIKKVVYFSMKVPNKPGTGLAMLKRIAKDRQNLLAFTGFPNSGRAQVDFVPARPTQFAQAARRMGVKVGPRKTAFLVQGQDRVGALTRILQTLAEARINMTAMDAVTAGSGRFGAIFWVRPKDVGRASRLLRAK
ncbi:MAG TPA: TIGR04282 family arsenosugar biosynthesis glycosyltransferase [Burkholderiales bacterium]|nr:TIGR04282 family arsenosugar biosynthesis glycosyltransferase [Burkholderiales bacterium]